MKYVEKEIEKNQTKNQARRNEFKRMNKKEHKAKIDKCEEWTLFQKWKLLQIYGEYMRNREMFENTSEETNTIWKWNNHHHLGC